MRASFIEELKEHKIKEEKYLNEELLKKDSFPAHLENVREHWIEMSNARIKRTIDTLSFVEDTKNSNEDCLEKQLEYNGLDAFDNGTGMTLVKGWTSMWNGMDDAGPIIPMLLAILKMKNIMHDFNVEEGGY